MPDVNVVPAPTVGEADLTKRSPPLDFRSTVSNPLDQYPTTIIVAFPTKTPIPDATNTPVDPNESFKTIVSDITEALPFLISPISYKPVTVLLHMEYFKQEIIGAAANYKASVTHPNKYLLLMIIVLINILTSHIQDHQTHSSTVMNLNPDLKSEATIETHRFHKAKKHMAGVVPPPTPGSSCTKTSSYDVRIT